MKRRNFLRNLGLATTSIPFISLSSCKAKLNVESINGVDKKRHPFYFKREDLLLEKSVMDLQDMLKKGEITSVQLTEWYLSRIKAIDSKEGAVGLNSIIEVNPDAILIAQRCDEERKRGNVRGELHGIPFVIKDNIDTGDKMQTTAGSLALVGHHAEKDAPIIQQLRDAGAVLIAKTNLSEWANFRSTKATSGWSSRGGQTKNPYVLSRNPCGSSAGTGAAISANLAPIGIGTETNGSIVCPSSVNGIVGIKPTVGLLSRTGIIPVSHTQDSAGPMAKTVTDAAIMLGAMTGKDKLDSATLVENRKIYSDYTYLFNLEYLKGKQFGLLKGSADFHDGIGDLFIQAQQILIDAGADIIEVDLLPTINQYYSDSFDMLKIEFKFGLAEYFKTVNDISVRSLNDVIAFNKENAAEVMPYFKQEILEMSANMPDLNSEEYKRLYAKVHGDAKAAIDNIMSQYGLTAILAPTTSAAWCTDLINGDNYSGSSSTIPAWAGYPSVTLPMGFLNALPVGLSFIGGAWQEPQLIASAYAYEQLTKHRKAPQFLSNL